MKRTSILFLVIAVFTAMTAAAGAAPKDRPNKPGKGNADPVEVSIDKANKSTWTLHEVGDTTIYDVTVTNNSASTIENVSIVGTVGGVRVFLDHTIDLAPTGTVLTTSYTVVQDDVDAGSVAADVRVTDSGEELASAVHVQDVDPVDVCGFELEGGVAAWTGRWVRTGPNNGDACIFKPATLVRANGTSPTVADAHWTFTAEPVDVTKPTGVLFTMRDDIPGNWCQVPDPASGYYTDGPPPGYYDDGNAAVLEWDPATVGGRTRWRPGDQPITRHFYFPPGEFGSVPNELTGVCLGLGAGGDMMGVGNTNSFYLVAPGRVTVEQRADFPPTG